MVKISIQQIKIKHQGSRKTVKITMLSINEVQRNAKLFGTEIKTGLNRFICMTSKLMKKAGNETTKLKEKSSSEKQCNRTENSPKVNNEEAGFVIDASITGIEEFENLLSNLWAKAKIILTSVTIRELDKMQKFDDRKAVNARIILRMAAENQNHFHTVLIDETLETPDDCIVKYCADCKDKVVLFTSDKVMTLKARMYGVRTQYLRRKPKEKCNQTLRIAKKEGEKLCINYSNTSYKSILVISDGVEHNNGKYELKIGDDVYIATNKQEYITFAHYRITSLSEVNNCELVYSKRIFNEIQIMDLPDPRYKNFVQEFKRRINL